MLQPYQFCTSEYLLMYIYWIINLRLSFETEGVYKTRIFESHPDNRKEHHHVEQRLDNKKCKLSQNTFFCLIFILGFLLLLSSSHHSPSSCLLFIIMITQERVIIFSSKDITQLHMVALVCQVCN